VISYYGIALDLPPTEVRRCLAADFGYITPKVGSEAAIFDPEGRILLVLRADNQSWCLPCGWVEPNESPMETAVREVREETGLEVRPVKLVDVFARMPGADYGPHTQVAVVYLCECIGGTLQGSHESLDVRYWQVDEVPVWHPQHESYARTAYTTWQLWQSQSR